jgi:L-glyceraldehyde 3-phosphate reductase
VEEDLLDTLDDLGLGCIAFSPLAQGVLTGKYLNGIPADARINRPGGTSLRPEHLNERNLEQVRTLQSIAQQRGQSLAQMALAWVLRAGRVTSALVGASKPAQIMELVESVKRLEFTPDELAAIDRHATEGGINLWQRPSADQRPG